MGHIEGCCNNPNDINIRDEKLSIQTGSSQAELVFFGVKPLDDISLLLKHSLLFKINKASV